MKKLCFLIFLFLCTPALAQPYYGKAMFYRTDAWSHNNLKYHWKMVSANSESGEVFYNDLEEWCPSPYTTCTNPLTDGDSCAECPEGCTCYCGAVHPNGTVVHEDTIVYSGEKSAKITTEVAITGVYLAVFIPLDAGKTYQISYADKGAVGTETNGFCIYDPIADASYNFTTNSWDADGTGIVTESYVVSANWVNRIHTVINDVDRAYAVIFIVPQVAGSEVIYVDAIETRLGPATIGDLSYCLGGSPQFGSNEKMFPRVGNGPAGNFGVNFDGVNDCLVCADADCNMDPATWSSGGSFSVGVRYYNDFMLFKGDIFSRPTMEFFRPSTENMALAVWSTGLVFPIDASLTTDGNAAYDATNYMVGTYDAKNPGGSTITLYYNNVPLDANSQVTDATANIPINSASTLQIGYETDGATTVYISGSVEEIAVWEGASSAIESSKWNNPYFPAGKISDGFYVTTCDQTSTHARCSQHLCTNASPYSCHADGTGSIPIFNGATNISYGNSSFDYLSGGTEESPVFFFFGGVESNGNGSAKIRAHSSDVFYAESSDPPNLQPGYSVRMTLTGTTSYAQLNQACSTAGIGDNLYIYLAAKKLSGTPNFRIKIIEYDDAACAGNVIQTATITDTVQEDWSWIGGLKTLASWDVSTLGYVIQLESYHSASDMLFDFLNVMDTELYFVPPVFNLFGGTSYVSRAYTVHNPLSDYDSANSRYAYTTGFCASMWLYTDWAGNDNYGHYIFSIPPTAGTNNLVFLNRDPATSRLEFAVYNGAGAIRRKYATVNAVNWTAGNWKYIEVCSDNNGTLLGKWYNVSNSTWYPMDATSGVGGIQTGQSSSLSLGYYVNDPDYLLEGYISEFTISPYNAAYTYAGFNGGKIPTNHNSHMALAGVVTQALNACGDGVINPPEVCDFGAPQSDNCCTLVTCQFTANGLPDPQTTCALATECQNDVCDGAGGCTTTNKAAATACTDSSPLPDNCKDAQCDGAGVCDQNYANEADGTACTDDTLYCTGVETCQTGVCTSSGNPCPIPANCDEVNDDCTVDGDTAWDDAILHVAMEENNPPWDGTTPNGEITQDSTAENNDMTAACAGDNVITSTTGLINDAFAYNVFGSLNAPLHAEFETDVISINIWARRYFQVPAVYQIVFGKEDATVNGWHLMITPNPNNHLEFQIKKTGGGYCYVDNDLSWSGGESAPHDVWHMFTGTFDGANINLYIDSVNVATAPCVATLEDHATWNVSIGNVYNCSNLIWQYTGDLDEGTMWDRAITQDEIDYLYNGGAGRAYGM